MYFKDKEVPMFKKTLKYVLPLVFLWAGLANAQTRYTPSELDTLVSTIALYPDPLLVHVLEATTHVEDLPRASAFATANRHLKGDDLASAIERAELDYEESVIALIPFPDVLRKLAKYATWSNQLGEAVEMQKADVMDAVQRMRKVAHKNGYLQSDDKIAVSVDDNVSIQPVREEYVYVPEYDPRVVYYVVSDGNIHLRYVNGVWTGAGLVYWGWDPFYYDWVHRRPHYRHPHRYAPPPRHRVRPRPAPGPHFHNPPPPRGRFNNPPPPRSNSSWDRRPSAPAPAPSRTLNKRQEIPSDNSRPAPPPPSNYKRPAPPPPQASSSNDDEDNRWNSRRSESHHGPRNAPPPPPSRRR
jgi:hypothetical protein